MKFAQQATLELVAAGGGGAMETATDDGLEVWACASGVEVTATSWAEAFNALVEALAMERAA